MIKIKIFIENGAKILRESNGININLRNNDAIMYLKTEYLDYASQNLNASYFINVEQEKKYIKKMK